MQALLLLHGALGSREQFKDLQRELSTDFDVYTMNFPGHNGSNTDLDFSIGFFAESVLEFISKNNLESINIFGYSMGGYVGMYLAKNHPQKITSLVTLATKFHWNTEVAEREIKMLNPEVIVEKIPAFAKILEERYLPGDWRIVLQKTAALLKSLGENNIISTDDYKHVQTPALLMLGDRDKMVSLEETVAVFKSLPNASLAILPKTPHAIDQINPSVLAWHIRNFLVTANKISQKP